MDPLEFVVSPLGGDILRLLVLLIGGTAERLHDLAERLLPLLLPPTGLRITSVDGGEITGILVVERNEVLGGIVIHHGGGESKVTVHAAERLPLDRYADSGSQRLRGWADDPRDDEEPWR